MTMNGKSYLQLGWNKFCIDVKFGEHCTIPWPKCDWSGVCVKYWSVAVWYVALIVYRQLE